MERSLIYGYYNQSSIEIEPQLTFKKGTRIKSIQITIFAETLNASITGGLNLLQNANVAELNETKTIVLRNIQTINIKFDLNLNIINDITNGYIFNFSANPSTGNISAMVIINYETNNL